MVDNVNNAKVFVGSKFFRFVNNSKEPEIIRIKSVMSENAKHRSATYDGKDGKTHRISVDYLLQNYSLLSPDGMIMFSIVEVGEASDVIVALKNFKKETPNDMPYAICRQGISDVFTNQCKAAENENVHYLGCSISLDTCPVNVDFRLTLECTGCKYNKPVVIYIDDTLDDILGLFGHTRFDNTLKAFKKDSIAKESKNNDVVFMGFCESLRDLLEINKFMYDFRKCFNIIELPFSIKDNIENEALSRDNTQFLEDLLKVNIMETYVVKYDKTIDLKSITRNYVLATSLIDDCKELYLVGYDVSDDAYVRH